jgi:hypothetical protein
MKNVHILPTDKPSRLIHNDANQLCYQSNKSFKNDRRWMYRKKFNIYITSDEDIKEGDWCIDKHNFVYKQETDKIFSEFTGSKKIILTTDQDLIKDGVQAIDNEFLEWFVKNPSCDEVEVKTRYVHYYKTGEKLISFTKTPEFSSRNMQCIKIEPRYEIIIPQDESKRKIDICYNFDMEIGCVQDICRCEQEEPKQLNCCTPVNQIKRYVDCVGCDRKPKQISKPTAVEWLQEKLLISLSDELKCLNGFFVIAKEMEKEQIIDAINHGCSDWGSFKDGEQYYEETFKKI